MCMANSGTRRPRRYSEGTVVHAICIPLPTCNRLPPLVPSRHFLLLRCWDSLVLCDLGCMHAHIDSSISSLRLGPWPPADREMGGGVGRVDDWQRWLGHVRVPYPSPESKQLISLRRATGAAAATFWSHGYMASLVGPVRRCA